MKPNDSQRHPSLIDTNQQLTEFCARASKYPAISVDTEFIMERHYWADLCLVQVGFKDGAGVVDTKKEGLDLAPLWRLLGDTKIEKVFHAAYEDMMIIKHASGILPLPAFDTQVAAMFCWYEDNPGYGNLVKALFGDTIDKSQQRSDWTKRPLVYRQVEYALHDVTYLIRVYGELLQRLRQMDRLRWFREECAYLNQADHYDNDPLLAWKRLHPRRPTRRALAILRELAAWRERHARHRDKPVRWVLQDNVLEDIANAEPQTQDDLARVRSIPQGFRNSPDKYKGIWMAVERGLKLPEDEMPHVERLRKDQADVRLLELFRVLLGMLCREHNIAPSIVANGADLRQLAAPESRARHSRLLKGWRHEMYGELAMDFKMGRKTFGYKKGRTIIASGEGSVPIISKDNIPMRVKDAKPEPEEEEPPAPPAPPAPSRIKRLMPFRSKP